ncbi:uncharacterized protein LOC114239333 [Bombyx mandarina]|uniref:Uncharacterized protein LOC114239333 n=1 Tax=Bombyx mandarina TaxID=7092 RepID=A0A6J2J7A0_BOMMA|nr:uncharacterized protein LOC114239333 [Bombyx mandarina]
MLAIFVLIMMSTLVTAKDAAAIDFVINFIGNENKPSDLVYGGLCWGKHAELNFVKAAKDKGVRASGSLNTRVAYHEQDIIFLADLDCNGSHEFLYNASSKHLFRFPYRWLVLLSSTNEAKLMYLWRIPLLITSDLVLARRYGDFFELVELHKPAPSGSMITTPRGFFNGSLIDIRPQKELYRRRRNLMGHHLTMANIIQDSNTTKYYLPRDDRLQLHHDAVAKVCWVFAKVAFELLNATPRYTFSYRFGYKVNGQWSGMVRDIGDNKADLGKRYKL